MKAAPRKYIMSAAPQCIFPDTNVGPALAQVCCSCACADLSVPNLRAVAQTLPLHDAVIESGADNTSDIRHSRENECWEKVDSGGKIMGDIYLVIVCSLSLA